MKTLQISIDDEMWEKLQRLAEKEGQAVEDFASHELKKTMDRYIPLVDYPVIELFWHYIGYLDEAMRAINGFARVIWKGQSGEISAEVHQDLTVIVNRARETLSYFHALKDLMVMEKDKYPLVPLGVDITALLLDVKDRMATYHHYNVTITPADVALPAVMGDEFLVRQALMKMIELLPVEEQINISAHAEQSHMTLVIASSALIAINPARLEFVIPQYNLKLLDLPPVFVPGEVRGSCNLRVPCCDLVGELSRG